MKIGSQIRRLRKSKGFNQKTFSSMLNLTQIYYCGIEKDRFSTTINVLDKIAQLTDTQLVITFIEKE